MTDNTETRHLRETLENVRTERDQMSAAALSSSRNLTLALGRAEETAESIGDALTLLNDMRGRIQTETDSVTISREYLNRITETLTGGHPDADLYRFQAEPYRVNPERIARACEADQHGATVPPEVAARLASAGAYITLRYDAYNSALEKLRGAALVVGEKRSELEHAAECLRLDELYPRPAEGDVWGLYWMVEESEIYIARSLGDARDQLTADTGQTVTDSECGVVQYNEYGSDENGEPITLYQQYAQALEPSGGEPLKPFQIWTQYT